MSALTGKVALVTGASSGIGAATAAALFEQGARVVACARREDRLHELAKKLGAGDDGFLAVKCDVRDANEAQSLLSRTVEWGGKLDILINNAGLSRGSLHEYSNAEDLRLMLDTNVFALANLSRLAIPALKQAAGDIVNVSSTVAKAMIPGSALYSATKAAVAAFSEVLRKELGPAGVRLVTIYPGFVDTEFFDYFDAAKKQGLAQLKATMDVLSGEDLAAVIVFALTRPPHVALNEIVVRPTQQTI